MGDRIVRVEANFTRVQNKFGDGMYVSIGDFHVLICETDFIHLKYGCHKIICPIAHHNNFINKNTEISSDELSILLISTISFNHIVPAKKSRYLLNRKRKLSQVWLSQNHLHHNNFINKNTEISSILLICINAGEVVMDLFYF